MVVLVLVLVLVMCVGVPAGGGGGGGEHNEPGHLHLQDAQVHCGRTQAHQGLRRKVGALFINMSTVFTLLASKLNNISSNFIFLLYFI